ncbi:glycosyltransferase family 2 protein [Labilibaculum sp. DW002]|uniref:Glycosyltransferase family 2 protein n=1 Tax=Paralabilibaculum antarcticum TaxID=2912572 RepID=A0ABT5VTD7_9BACT|nr:glycosyltransferase family 2 protein [Labilibaculum sp. DW002]MDE5417554.1 glycosyltransferase family 2 protein [Labilibaculum sp. DW002]
MNSRFSIVILTYNEEDNIPSCLKSIGWCDDIVVIDSYSKDKTIDIAEKHGARVFQNKFIDFAQQRNFANETVAFKYEWVFHLDADEHFTEALRQECNKTILDYKYGAFLVPAKEMLWATWLKYSAGTVYQMRFHKLKDARFEQYGHGQRECDLMKGMGKLKEPYVHYFMSKGINQWFVKHLKYASDECSNEENISLNNVPFLKLINGKSHEKRRVLKAISYKLPLRPFFKFIYMYVIKLGFLDGMVGFRFCVMKAIYEQFIILKKNESIK